ncbi:MAG: hypothetical protein AB7F86_14525 [Bdellovibrionales bacterium]
MKARKAKIIEKLEKKELQPLQLSQDGRTLYLNGPIDKTVGDAFSKFTDEQKARVQFFVLNSNGGSVAYASSIEKWVFEKGAQLKTIVPRDGICASACAEIFRCGHHRVADESAYLLFHAASDPKRVKRPEGKPCIPYGQPGFDMADSCHDMPLSDLVTNLAEDGQCAKHSGMKDGKWTKVGQQIREASLGTAKKKPYDFCVQASSLGDKDSGFLEIEGAKAGPNSGGESGPTTK